MHVQYTRTVWLTNAAIPNTISLHRRETPTVHTVDLLVGLRIVANVLVS
jgi:hypothetical protein